VPAQRFVEEAHDQRALRGRVPLTVVLCFEVIYPRLVAARSRPDVKAIVNLANDSWYDSDIVGEQQLAFASFRAIEQRRWLVRVAEGGPSAVLDPFGRIVRKMEHGRAGFIEARIEERSDPEPGAVGRITIAGLALCGSVTGALVWHVTRRLSS
jgi:apolipoprotein N-acyltransferase